MLITGSHNNVRLSPEEANSFGGKVRKSAIYQRFSRSLNEECYWEHCSFEEVREAKRNTESAVSNPQIPSISSERVLYILPEQYIDCSAPFMHLLKF